MDLIKTVSSALAIVCIVIGVLLLPLGGWFLWNGLKNRDRPSVIIAILILVLAVLAFIGAFNLFTNGIMQTSPYLNQQR